MVSTITAPLARPAWLLVAVAVAGASPLAAQRPPSGYGLREVRDRGTAGATLVLGVPQGEFGRNVNVAGGVNLFAAPSLGGGPLGLRFDGSYLIYGSQHQYVWQPYVPLDIRTTYSIASLGVGPQFTLGRDSPLRLYGFGTVGVSYIFAHSSYDAGTCGCDLADAIDFDDWTTAFQGGAGLLIVLNRRHQPISLDLGARYFGNDAAWYATSGDIVPQPSGDVVVYATHSRLDLLLFHLGVSVALR